MACPIETEQGASIPNQRSDLLNRQGVRGLVEDANVMTRQDLQNRAQRTVDTIHDRYHAPTGQA